MKRLLTLAVLTLAIGGCNVPTSADKRRAIEQKLPPGCSFLDLGRYEGTDIYAVVCNGVTTTNLGRTVQSGKTSRRQTTVVITASADL